MTHKELIKEINQLPVEQRQALLEESWESMLEQNFPNFPYKIILSGLNPEDLNIFFLSVVNDLSAAEIAREIGEPPDRVLYRLKAVRAKIRYRARKYLKETGSRKLKEESGFNSQAEEQAGPEFIHHETSRQKTLSQRLYGILKFDRDPPNDEEVKDTISDYLIRKYS